MIALALILAAAAHASSAKTPTHPTAHAAPAPLAKGSTLTLAPQQIKIRITDVNNSRCPEGAQCVWAGELAVTATVSRQRKTLGVVRVTDTKPATLKLKNCALTVSLNEKDQLQASCK